MANRFLVMPDVSFGEIEIRSGLIYAPQPERQRSHSVSESIQKPGASLTVVDMA